MSSIKRAITKATRNERFSPCTRIIAGIGTNMLSFLYGFQDTFWYHYTSRLFVPINPLINPSPKYWYQLLRARPEAAAMKHVIGSNRLFLRHLIPPSTDLALHIIGSNS